MSDFCSYYIKDFEKEIKCYGTSSGLTTGPILAENHVYARNQSSTFSLLDGARTDKNTCPTIKTTKISLRASAAAHKKPCGNLLNRLWHW